MNQKKILSVLFAGVLCLSPIGVKAAQMYAENEEGTKVYTSIDDAWDAAQSGTKIIMSCDWNLSERLVLDSSKTATIEMNGHKISRNLTSAKTNGEVIKLCKDSTLNLNGKKKPKSVFSFDGYVNGISTKCSTNSGGLITGGYSTNGGGGIHMKGGSSLNLDSVSISGNKSNRSLGSDGHGGAIYMDGSGDQLTMNNAEITFNAAQRDGGAIYVDYKNASITLTNSDIVNNTAGASLDDLAPSDACGGAIATYGSDLNITLNENSKIDENYAHGFGGAIYSEGQGTKINLNASSINFNKSDYNGGAIYFYYSKFEVISSNHDGQISHNKAQSEDRGGAIFTDSCTFTSSKGTIDGITFEDNFASRGGGALDNNQENVTVSNCVFTKNTSDSGSAINLNEDDFVLENTTIQNNITNSEYSAAVDVQCFNDITLKGIINITNNTNSAKNTDTDLIVQTDNWYKSYILSTPDASSRIGLHIDSDRTIAKNQTSDAMNIFFVNNPDQYTIRYDESSKEIVSEEATNAEVATVSNNPTSYVVTINMVNEAGTWQQTQKMTINENEPLELQAPAVEDKEFVEYKDVPESLTVEENTISADSLSSDTELTLVYSDSESEESTETGSIFGDGNVAIAAIIVVVLVVVGAFIFIKKKKQ